MSVLWFALLATVWFWCGWLARGWRQDVLDSREHAAETDAYWEARKEPS